MYRSKVLHFFSLLCVLSLCLGVFGFDVSAASGNLISSDLTTWTDATKYEDSAYELNVYQKGDIFRVGIPANTEYAVYFGAILDKTSLTAGHSYTLTFTLPSSAEIAEAWGTDYTDDRLYGNYTGAELFVSVGFINALGEITVPEGNILFQINEENCGNYLGKSLRSSFVASNYTGTPCVMIQICSTNGKLHYMFFKDFCLVDNDDNSAELTGIKGFLHSIRWDLIGGQCDDEDCPHSVPGNEHLSLTERMSAGFQALFENIGNKFEEGSTLNTWFNNLSDKFSEGSPLSSWFTELKENTTNKFSSLSTSLNTWFDGVKQKFQDIGDAITTKLSDVGESITLKFQEIGEKFTEFFEKFKPRVEQEFEWQHAYLRPSDGSIWGGSNAGQYYLITELFSFPSDVKFKVSYDDVNFQAAYIYYYDLEGNYLGSYHTSTTAFEDFELSPDYQYRFSIRSVAAKEEDVSELCNGDFHVYADEGWLNALIFKIKNSIKGLFVPDEAAINGFKDDVDVLLQEHLGIIYTSTSVISDLLNKVFDIVFDAPDTYSLSIPEVSFEVSGTKVDLLKEQDIDFSFMKEDAFKKLYSAYIVVLYVFFGVLEVKYGDRVRRRMMNN